MHGPAHFCWSQKRESLELGTARFIFIFFISKQNVWFVMFEFLATKTIDVCGPILLLEFIVPTLTLFSCLSLLSLLGPYSSAWSWALPDWFLFFFMSKQNVWFVMFDFLANNHRCLFVHGPAHFCSSQKRESLELGTARLIFIFFHSQTNNIFLFDQLFSLQSTVFFLFSLENCKLF